MKEEMVLWYKNLSEDEIKKVVELLKNRSFSYLGRTIPLRIEKSSRMHFWKPDLYFMVRLQSSNRDYLLAALHIEFLNILLEIVTPVKPVENVIYLNNETQHTSLARRIR